MLSAGEARKDADSVDKKQMKGMKTDCLRMEKDPGKGTQRAHNSERAGRELARGLTGC